MSVGHLELFKNVQRRRSVAQLLTLKTNDLNLKLGEIAYQTPCKPNNLLKLPITEVMEKMTSCLIAIYMDVKKGLFSIVDSMQWRYSSSGR